MLFSICTLPFKLFFIYLTAVEKTIVADNRERLLFVHKIVTFLLITNSFFNPFLHALRSSNYRKGFKRIARNERMNKERKRETSQLY